MGPLGWTETVLKTAGAGVGVAAFLVTLGVPADGPGGMRLAQVILLAILSLGLVAGVYDRLLEREVIGIVFVPMMLVGHVAMTLALARDADAGTYAAGYVALLVMQAAA